MKLWSLSDHKDSSEILENVHIHFFEQKVAFIIKQPYKFVGACFKIHYPELHEKYGNLELGGGELFLREPAFKNITYGYKWRPFLS